MLLEGLATCVDDIHQGGELLARIPFPPNRCHTYTDTSEAFGADVIPYSNNVPT